MKMLACHGLHQAYKFVCLTKLDRRNAALNCYKVPLLVIIQGSISTMINYQLAQQLHICLHVLF